MPARDVFKTTKLFSVFNYCTAHVTAPGIDRFGTSVPTHITSVFNLQLLGLLHLGLVYDQGKSWY